MNDTDISGLLGYTPRVREISEAREEAQTLSSGLYDLIALRGRVTEPGPGVAVLDGLDPETYYHIHHPWALSGAPVERMREAMVRLLRVLPDHGWKIVAYGRERSAAQPMGVIADCTTAPFSVKIRLLDGTPHPEPDAPRSKIFVDLLSACFRIPDGRIVDEY
ncbi:hypothetical protein GCM10027168_53800 [Streptomyces capparidis]